MNLRWPYQFDETGRTATADDDAHVRAMLEELLFTHPGERVNRPDLGSGVLQLVFAPGSPEIAATVQVVVQAALQQWLGDRVRVDDVAAESSEGRLQVTVRYTHRRSGAQQTVTLTRAGGP